MRIRPCGDAALLVELGDLVDVMSLAAALNDGRASAAAVTDVVPAAQTILVRFDPAHTGAGRTARWIRDRWIERSVHAGAPGETGPSVEIAVGYDGADLDEVGELTGLGRDGVIEAHTARPWTVAFVGFAPGFAYCTGGDPRLWVPRRSTAREKVPAGAVGLADNFTAVYPRSSPGGWQLIGHTDTTVWDLQRDPPALLIPGTIVRFRAT